jgi:hypothetical protein
MSKIEVALFLFAPFLQIIYVLWSSWLTFNCPTTHLVQEVSVWLFLDLGFNFHLEFRQCKFINLPWYFFLNKLNLTCYRFVRAHQTRRSGRHFRPISAEIALPRLQSEIKVALFLFASRSFLANNLRFMVKLIFSETALPKWTEIWWEAPIGYGRFCIKFPQSRMKGERHRLSSVLSL